MMIMNEWKGIDLSEYNTNVNWNQWTNLDFVILRAGYGKYVSQKDKLFETHYTNAKQRGIKVGIYWYSYAVTPEEAAIEAKCCLDIIKGHDIDYPVYFDIEESRQHALGCTVCSNMVKAFCDVIEAAGYSAGFYCNVSFYNSVISDAIKKRYTCWIAHWDVTKPAVNAPLWQYTVDRVNNIDMDVAYTDFSTWHKKTESKPAERKIKAKIIVDGIEYEGELKSSPDK